jgi:ABC-type sugar transport system ATPase subunit
VVVLRGGKLAGERKTAEATRRELAELMVGGQLPVNEIGPASPRNCLFELNGVSTRSLGGAALKQTSMQLRGGEITGLAGISAMARLRWRRLFREPWKPWRAKSSFTAKKSGRGRLALRWRMVWGGYRKTGMQPA